MNKCDLSSKRYVDSAAAEITPQKSRSMHVSYWAFIPTILKLLIVDEFLHLKPFLEQNANDSNWRYNILRHFDAIYI